MSTRPSYWTRRTSARYGRRTVLQLSAAAGGAFAATIFAGCSRKGNSPSPSAPASQKTPRPGGTLRLLTQSGPTVLDAQRTTSGPSLNVSGFALSRLFRFRSGLDPKAKDDSDIESDLAVSAESADAVTWTIKLRQKAKFQNIPPVNGHAVEAEDIRASFIRALMPQNPSHNSLNMLGQDQIETPSNDTVVFKLNYPYGDFRTLLASPKYSWIVPREALAGAYDPNKQVIGSGPFMFENYTPDVSLQYRRNPDWFEAGHPYVDAVQDAIVPGYAQQLAQFTAGNIDLLEQVKPNDLETVKRDNPKAQIFTYRRRGNMVIEFPLGDPSSPFQDIRLRRAMSLAIDRAAIGKALWGDVAEQQFVVPLVIGKWALRVNELPAGTAQWYKYDPAQAKKLVEDAGGSNLNLKFAYFTPNPQDPLYSQAAEAIHNMLTALPWKVTLVQMNYQKDWLGGGKGMRYGNIPLDTVVFLGLEGFTSVDDFLYGYWYSQSGTAITRVKDSALDAMLDKARRVVNDDQRLQAYKDVQKYIADKLYAVSGLFQGNDTSMAQPQVQRYTYNPIDNAVVPAGLWLAR